MVLGEFCKDLRYDVLTLAALQCTWLCHQNGTLLAGGEALFQSIDVSHLPSGGGPLSILSQSRHRFTSPVITLNSSLNWLMVPSYGSVRRAYLLSI